MQLIKDGIEEITQCKIVRAQRSDDGEAINFDTWASTCKQQAILRTT